MFGQNAVAVVNPRMKQLQDLYTDAVRECLGAISKIDGDGDVVFKYGGIGTVYISCDDTDLRYFRLVDQIELVDNTPEAEFKVLKAINTAAQIKCAKQSLRVANGKLILVNAIEAYLAPKDAAPSRDIVFATLERYADMLVAARQKFLEEIEKLGGLN